MNTYNDELDPEYAPTPDGWVLESCFLDLLVDEENPEDLDELALQLECPSVLANARARLEKIRPTDKDTCWPEIKEFDDPSRVMKVFLDMKAARARALLDCNRIRYKYAQLPDEAGSQSVSKALLVVSNTLDLIILDSLAAFGSIRLNPDEALKEEWSVLAALFHSEVCASGTTEDVSYGMARAFDRFFPSSQGLPWRPLFQLVSTHNKARGLGHQHSDVECIRQLEPLLEGFDSKMKNLKKYLPLAVRLVYFPAVFTLAESLKDCHRTTEAAWWLRLARDERKPGTYWKSRIDVELLSILGSPKDLNLYIDKPKLGNADKQRIYMTNERLISNTLNKIESSDLDDYISKWAEALAWTIRWHEGDSVNLPGTIQGTAQSVQTVAAALKARKQRKQDNISISNLCLDNIIKVLESLRQTILQQTIPSKSNPDPPVFQFLSPKNELADVPLTLMQGVRMWRPLKCLMPALKTTIELIEELDPNEKLRRFKSADLASWHETLIKRLTRAQELVYFEGDTSARFVDVASAQEVFKLLKNPTELCPVNPAGHRRPGCQNFPTCVEKTLRLGDPHKPSSDKPTRINFCRRLLPGLFLPDKSNQDKLHVASTVYLLNRMARTESEFTRFLQRPSSELSLDPKKPKEPVTPLTEFISLRRWNSFSPNLASRATTTVGGGYLVRIWDERFGKHGEYIGIAIDPGYNYLENLFDEGFTLPDIHVIVVTHAHPDHVENLSNIFTLLRERVDRTGEVSRVYLVLTEGVFQRFKTLIDNEMDFIHDVVVLSWVRQGRNKVHVVRRCGQKSNGGSISLTMGGDESIPLVSIQAIKAIHADGTEFDSMGVVVQVMNEGGNDSLRIGFTGDTSYWKGLCTDGGFAKCNVLVPHLGSIIGREAFCNSHETWSLSKHEDKRNKALEELQQTLTKKNHLYLPGISMLLCDLKEELKELKPSATEKTKTLPLILLSEFGEELRGGLRADLARRLEDVFQIRVLPVDVGLRVGVADQSVRCAICRQYVSANHTQPVAVSDEDEALVFVCDDCYTLRQHELPLLLSRLRKMPPEYHPTNESEARGDQNPA